MTTIFVRLENLGHNQHRAYVDYEDWREMGRGRNPPAALTDLSKKIRRKHPEVTALDTGEFVFRIRP